MNILTQLFEKRREKGVFGAFKIVSAYLRDLSFDLKHGTDTMGWRQLDGLDVVGQNKAHGLMYQPTQAHTLRRVFRKSSLPPEGAFLELGCGKGRALILAAEYGTAGCWGWSSLSVFAASPARTSSAISGGPRRPRN